MSDAGAARRVRPGAAIAAAGAWVLAALVTLAPVAAGPLLLTAVLVLVPAASLRRGSAGRRRRVLLQVVATAVACGAVCVGVLVQQPLRVPAGLPVGRSLGMTVRVGAVSTTTGDDAAGSFTTGLLVRGTLLSAVGPGVRVSAAAPVLVFAAADALPGAAARDPGTVLALTGRASRADATDDVTYTVDATGRARIVEGAGAVQAAAARLRAVLVRHARSLPGDGGALLPGVSIGDTSGVDRSLDAAMKASSLSHLTAVSGANCAVVTVAVFALAGLLRLRRRTRVVAAAVALIGFVVLVTPQPSVLRSAVMALIALGCLASGRTVAGLPALGVAVVALLSIDPWMARNASFVLSALATAGLLVLTRPIAAGLARVLPERFALLLAVPTAAQAACEPVLVLLQPVVPLFGVAANLLAEPAAPVATILGLLACLTLPVVPLLGDGLALLGWLPTAWIAAVARFCAALPSVGWPVGAAGAALAAGLLVAGVLAFGRRSPLAVRVAAGSVLLLLALSVGGTQAGGVIGRLGTPTDWVIAACDVGQGDGLVLNGGDGHYAMVDTGRYPDLLARCLARLHVGRLQLLLLTHWDADHVAAARALVGRVDTAFVGPSDGPAGDALRAAIANGGARVVQAHRGDQAQVGDLRLRVLWPPDPLGSIEPGNAASVTALVDGPLTALFTGDLGEDAQNALLALGPLPKVDVVKVAHHGSADQSPELYREVDAGVGLISCGVDNDYHHPTPRLLRILAAVGTQPVRTDEDGLILVRRRPGGGVVVWTERPITAAVWTPAK